MPAQLEIYGPAQLPFAQTSAMALQFVPALAPVQLPLAPQYTLSVFGLTYTIPAPNCDSSHRTV
jgi:hypothetical protein